LEEGKRCRLLVHRAIHVPQGESEGTFPSPTHLRRSQALDVTLDHTHETRRGFKRCGGGAVDGERKKSALSLLYSSLSGNTRRSLQKPSSSGDVQTIRGDSRTMGDCSLVRGGFLEREKEMLFLNSQARRRAVCVQTGGGRVRRSRTKRA